MSIINIAVGEILHYNGIEITVIAADNVRGYYTVVSSFDSMDVWTVKASSFDEV